MESSFWTEIKKFCDIADQKNEDSSFLIFDIDDVVEKVKQWREQMPRVDPHYAVKCNSDPVLLRTLAALGIGFDCSNWMEIETIVSLGVPVDRIVYANTWKERSHLRRAADSKIKLMTFDTEEELLKIKQFCPSAKLLLRLKVKAPSAKLKVNDKFGCEEGEVPHLLEVAIQHNLSVVGTSFYLGGQVQDSNDYVTAIKMCRQVFDTAEKKGIAMCVLDIGGGFPGSKPYQVLSRKTEFAEIAEAVNRAIDEYFPSGGPYKIFAEPGRYFPETAFTLCSKIIGKKRRVVDNEEDVMYIINEGVYGLFVHTTLHDIQPVMKQILSDSKPKRSSVWGHSCDPADIIVKKCMIPEMKVGDWIVFEEMGAYTTACATNFQGCEKTGVKRVISRKTLGELQKLGRDELNRILTTDVQFKEVKTN